MFGSILNRMIFWELVKVFLLSLGSLTGMFLMAVVVQEGSKLGLGLSQLIRIVPLFIPNLLPYTIPATTLFASCVVYGRLAHDNEVVAIKAAGVRLYRILAPAVLLGIITTTVTAGLYYTVIPQSQQLLQKAALRDPEEVLYNLLRRERCFRHPTFPYVMYVRDVQGKVLLDVVLKRRMRLYDPNTNTEAYHGYDFVARAREARLRVDLETGMLNIEPDRFVIYDKNTVGTTVSNHPFQVPLPDSLTGKEIRSRTTALTWPELATRIAELQRDREVYNAKKMAFFDEVRGLPEGPEKAFRLSQEVHFDAQLEQYRRSILSVQSEYHMRPALAFGCLVFALIGCPVGLWANRADYLSTFVVCFLPAIIVYYPLLLAGSNFGKDGKLPMFLGVWLANIVVGTLALLLTIRLLRR